MSLHLAEKIVIITERIIAKGVCDIIESCGATGYTIIAAGGKGSRNIRATTDRASIVEDFANVKIEIIVNDSEISEKIMDQVTDTFFQHYSGITYREHVEILRPNKFGDN